MYVFETSINQMRFHRPAQAPSETQEQAEDKLEAHVGEFRSRSDLRIEGRIIQLERDCGFRRIWYSQ